MNRLVQLISHESSPPPTPPTRRPQAARRLPASTRSPKAPHRQLEGDFMPIWLTNHCSTRDPSFSSSSLHQIPLLLAVFVNDVMSGESQRLISHGCGLSTSSTCTFLSTQAPGSLVSLTYTANGGFALQYGVNGGT